MKPFLLTLISILFFITGSVQAQSDYRVLPKDFNGDQTQQMMRAYLRHQVHNALDLRLTELEAALVSREQFTAYQKKRWDSHRSSLGEMPERTPLNARVTGIIKEKHFTIEKVLFESQPGFHVTCHVYRPSGAGPFPAILHPVGHSKNGKNYEAYQRANRLLVQNGFVVLCFDPIGQGERNQLIGPDGKPFQPGSREHQELGVASILLGRSLGSYMVWDGVRAIDYLCSRPDVDPKRIGCTGNSGGGNLTSYLMAYDERIVAAAPGCFITTHRRKNERPGPGDAEQNLFAQIRDGFDHPDFILARAPKPTLILSATKDFVPIEGAWEAFRQAKRAYTLLGYPERIELIEANEKHGFSQRLREGALRFFAYWLQGRRIEVFEEEDVPTLSDEALQVTPKGQVLSLPDARSMFDLFTEYEAQLASQRPKLTRAVVRDTTGIRPLAELPAPKVDVIAKTESHESPNKSGNEDHHSPQRLLFYPEPGIVLPALYWSEGNAEPILIAPAKGMNSAVKEAKQFNSKGHPVLIIEVRDTGETTTRNWRFFGADYYIAHMLGRCWLGMRTEDMLACSRWLKEQHQAKSVRLTADGELGPAAQHAAALEPGLISTVHTKNGLSSWCELMTSPVAHKHLHNAVQNVLQYYDLPDLKRL